MAAITPRVSTADTSNASTYVSGSFTPAAGDFLFAFCHASGTVDAGDMTASANSITFTRHSSMLRGTADTLYFFVADQLVGGSPVSMTVTFDCTGDAATGNVTVVGSISGMSKVGTAAVRQATTDVGGLGTTPDCDYTAFTPLTTNPHAAAVANVTNPAGVTQPASWTEGSDTGFATPDRGLEWAYINSGHTSTAVTCGSTSATAWSMMTVEFDASSSGTPATVNAVVATATGAAPAPSALAKATVAGVLAVATALAPVPTVTAKATVSVPVATASGAALEPTVTGTQPWATVSPPAATATATAPAPTVTAPFTGSAPTATATGDALAPSVTARASVSPPVATATGAALTPAATAASTVAGALATASGAALAPTLTARATVAATVATATATVLAPEVYNTPPGEVRPPPATATGAALVPVVRASVTVAAVTASANAAGLAPNLIARATVTATQATATATALTPVVSAPAAVDVPAAIASALALAPKLIAAATVQAPVATAVGTALVPTIIATPPPPASRVRTYTVASESRVLDIAESRITAIPNESRTYVIGA